MEQYDIYAIGNALLDMVYDVDDELLASLKIVKGAMTLIDEDKHHALLKLLPPKGATYACGGSAGNSIITAEELGAKTFFSCQVANDTAGNIYYHDLITRGTHTNLTEHNRPDGFTGKCIVLITPDGERTMCTYLGIAGRLSADIINEQAIKNSKYVYLEGYLASSEISFESALMVKELARKANIKTSASLADVNIINYFRNNIDKMVEGQMDLLFCNKLEALAFAQTDDLDQAEQYIKQYAKQYLITLGDEGAIAFDGEQRALTPAYNAKVVDCVGAGDTFAGAFLFAITRGHRFIDSATFANLAAAHVVEQTGPRLHIDKLNHLRQMLLKTMTV